MNRNLLTLILVGIAGAALAFAVAPLLGRTMAIASPAGYSDWFRSVDSVEAANLVWSFAVVGLLGAGIAVFLASLVAFQLATTSRAATLVTFVTGFFVGGHVLVPIYYGQDGHITSAFFQRGWWAYGLELSVVCSAVAAAFAHPRLSRRRGGRSPIIHPKPG